MKRWGEQTDLAIANFGVSGQPMPAAIIHALAHIKQHAAIVNATHGVLTTAVAEAIATAAIEVRRGDHADQFPIDVFQTGSGTSTNMNVNEVIAHRAAEHLGSAVHANDHVNASQSSNDVFPTALRLCTIEGILHQLVPALRHLSDALEPLARQHASTVKAGRTHMMDAAPMTFGQEVNGWRRSIELGIERLNSTVPRLLELPLGGTAVGTGLNAPSGFASGVIARLSSDLDLPLVEASDHFEAQSAQEPLLESSGVVRLVALSLHKIAGDLRLLSSGPLNGLGELELPELQAGSSIMPGKVNPVIAEVVQQVAAQVVGNDAAVVFASATGSLLQLNTAMPVIGRNLLESLRLVTGAANSLTERCVGGIRVNVEVMSAYAERSPAIAAALNPIIGYDAAKRVAQRAIRESRLVSQIALEEGLIEHSTLRYLDPLALATQGQRRGSAAKLGDGNDIG